ncbi:MAG: ABC transporter permease [Terriglobales bacterium]
MIATVAQDVRFAVRQLRRTPAFAAVAVLTLALGIGANTAVFSVMNAVLLQSLPVRDPQQLVYLHTNNFPGGQTGYGDTSLRMQVYQALRQKKDVFSDLMAWVPLSESQGIAIRYGAEPEEARGDMVSGNFFSGLGVPAARGRLFTSDDEQNHTQNAVLSYDYWSRRFGRDPSVIGHPLYVKGVPFTIIGVTAPGFSGLDEENATDLWIPFQVGDAIRPWGASLTSKDTLYGARWWFLLTVGRLQPGVTRGQAEARLNPLFQTAAVEDLPADDRDSKPPTLTLSDTRGLPGLKENYEQPLRVLMGMVGLVLVIACGNVAMLLIARNAARQREFSLRMALGGRRTRLFRQLLTESMLLVVSGALLGWLFALWATHALASWALLDRSLSPDLNVLLFTVGVSLVAGLVFGLAPLRSAVRVPIGLALKTSSATTHQDRHKHRSGQVVIALQMALCLVLLVGAGLLVRTMRNLENVNLGLRTEGLLVFGVNPQQHARTREEYIQFYQALLERMRNLPGVESATLMQNRLGSGWSSNTAVYVDGQKPKTVNSFGFAGVRWNAVGPNFFHAIGTPLVLGRDINDGDSAAAPNVAVVNETFVKKYLQGTTPIGHQISLNSNKDEKLYTIVGVAADSKYTSVRETPRPMAYLPYTQESRIGAMQVELRVNGLPEAFLPIARRAMTEFAPDIAMLQPMTQVEQFNQTLAQDRVFARLATFFGILAVLLVATGLYGTLAYKVARRTSEIGVRMALGARRVQVLWLVMRESMVLCAVGAMVGIAGSIAGVRWLRSMLYGVGPWDPGTFIAAIAGIVVVSIAASLVPARRAASVDPMVALRLE